VTSYTYNILSPTKKLSQLIAKSWLEQQPITLDKDFLVKNDILSEKEAEIFEIDEDEQPSQTEGSIGDGGYIDAVNFKIHIPYLERPPEVTNEALQNWINSSENSPPWVPEDESLKRVLIPWKLILGRSVGL
jgi:hypothetical protein